MSTRLRALVLVVPGGLVLLLAAACGGDGATTGSEAGAQGPSGEAPQNGPASAGEITDPPPAGEIRGEIDGTTYTETLANCQVTGATFLIGAPMEVDGNSYNLGGNGSGTGTRWIGQVGLTPRADGPTWSSNGGAITVEGSTVLYVGEFTKNDESGSTDVGEGRVIATCS